MLQCGDNSLLDKADMLWAQVIGRPQLEEVNGSLSVDAGGLFRVENAGACKSDAD